MKIVGFERDKALRLGVVEGDNVIDLQAADPRVPADLGQWLKDNDGDLKPLGDIAKRAPASARRPLAGLAFALPVARPGKIVCLGLNYLEHAKEGGHQKPEFPSIFMRCRTSLTPHLGPMVRPMVSETLDYEAELLVVIGRRMKHATPGDALACVAGYSCFNDGSIRRFQRRTSQWDMGKNFDQTGGFGPWVIDAAALPPGARGLKIESRLNGQVLQSDNTDNMIFPVVETIVDLTQAMTLEPGDVIAMGTPSGVGHARKPPLWMRAGDVCEIEIEGIGVLRNPIVDEAVAAGRAAAE
jgi:2-keto-4-pentenoate hydratase/2-oxohepta-3-ene-1,7-dioic acid hydratase in catechol pathway